MLKRAGASVDAVHLQVFRLVCVLSMWPIKGVAYGLQGVYTMDEVSWRGISVEAKELMNRLLTVDPSARPSASEV